jgi:hypothetical protein
LESVMAISKLEAYLISVCSRTKHGPQGRGGNGACDEDCLKCEAEKALSGMQAPSKPCPGQWADPEGEWKICVLAAGHRSHCDHRK